MECLYRNSIKFVHKKQYIKVQQIRGEIKIPPEQTFPLKLASKADKGLPGIKRKPNSEFLIEKIQ
jgi:hypothetical protein